ncbi:MAG: SAM-dependent methyltransferase [Rubrivivax sp.]|nr:SAM-dependent methyltransferase [Rubrivivax sp.]
MAPDAAATSGPTAAPSAPGQGRLLLVPNTLDLGAAAQPLQAALPQQAIQAAAQLGHWLVENAKSARAFLKRVDEVVPLRQSLQAVAMRELPRPPKGRPSPMAPEPADLLAPALAGHDMGLLSEAGLPGVADPGAGVVAAAHALGLVVVPLAGPSALTLALAASGLDGQSFAFVGYLPQEAAARREHIRELESVSRQRRQTQVFIETPYRNQALLAALLEAASPNSRLAISIGLTLPEGWSRTATIAQWRRRAPRLSDRLPAVFLMQA